MKFLSHLRAILHYTKLTKRLCQVDAPDPEKQVRVLSKLKNVATATL